MMRKVVLIVTLLAFSSAALIPAVANAVWKYKIESITWDTTTVDGRMTGGGGIFIKVITWDNAAPSPDTVALGFGFPLSFPVDTMRTRIEKTCKAQFDNRARADSLKTIYEGATANVPGTN